jgi:hypothetical protein
MLEILNVIKKEVELEAKNGNRVREPQRRIMILDRGRVLSQHGGALVYYASRHRIYQASLCGSFVKAGKPDVEAKILPYSPGVNRRWRQDSGPALSGRRIKSGF